MVRLRISELTTDDIIHKLEKHDLDVGLFPRHLIFHPLMSSSCFMKSL